MEKIDIIVNKSNLVVKDETWDCYVWAETNYKLAGITPRLKEHFYPRVAKVKSVKVQHQGPKIKKGKNGGKLVHEQIELFVKCAKSGQLKQFAQKCKPDKPDPRVLSIVNEIVSKKYQVLFAEYGVGIKDLRLGTGVDLMLLSPNGEVLLVELKTGYIGVYTTKTKGRMHEPFKMLDQSPWAQHQLQLLATKELFERMTGVKADFAEIWHVYGPRRPDRYPLHPDLEDKGMILLNTIKNKKKEAKEKPKVYLSKNKILGA